MRNMFRFLFFILCISSLQAQTTSTYRTEAIDGNNNFSATLEKFNTTRTQISAYVTWDKDNIYIAYSGNTPAGPISEGGRQFHIYFDTDPQLDPLQGTGTKFGEQWTWNPVLPFTANYHYVFEVNGTLEFLKIYNGESWVSTVKLTSNYLNTTSGFWEVLIPKSDLGNPNQVNIVSYIQENWSEGFITGGFPSGLFVDTQEKPAISFSSTFLNINLLDKIAPNNIFHMNNFGWSLKLKAVGGSALDTTALAGMFANATDGYDAGIDLPKAPPVPSNFIDVYFPREGWGSSLGPNYERDFKLRRDLSATTSTWTFTVNSDISGNITLSAASFGDIPTNYGIQLKDLSTTTVTDLRTGNYTYNNTPAEATSRNFELTIGVTLSNPTIVVDPTSLDFGTVKTDASKALGVLITNTGDQTLNISNMVVNGSIHYSFEGSTTATLAKNDTTTVFVRFHPKTAGTLTGTLTLTSNDPVNGSLVVNLTGIGQTLSPNIVVRVDTLNFGSVIAGGNSDLEIYVGNNGDTSLTVSSAVVAGTGFSNLGAADFIVAVNDSNGLSIRFTPPATGNFSGTLTFTSNDPDTPTKVVTLLGTGTTTTSSNEFVAGWNLMSIPVLPVSNLASNIIGDDIASFILYSYSGGAYQSSSTIDPALGYWLGLETTTTVDVEGTPIITDQTKALAGGWNLIASPFYGGSPKTNLRITRNDSTWTIDQAAAANLVQVPIYKYATDTKQYDMVTNLASWNGHWFFTIEPGLSVKYLFNVPADGISPKKEEPFEITPSNWYVDILSEMNGIKDKYLAFGTNEFATDGFDNSFDYVKAPISPAANAIESYFLQSGWTGFATKFASNIQAPLLNGINKSWSFKVYAKSSGSYKISWLDILNRIPQEIRNGYTFTLRGPGIPEGINMLSQMVYEFNVNAGGTYSFVINSSPVGIEEELMNLDFKLGQNYPNPFNPSTTINFSVKESGLVSLKIYDILGNEVVTLVNDVKQPGQYEVKFEASNLPSGTYIYKLVQGKYSEIKKLMLLK